MKGRKNLKVLYSVSVLAVFTMISTVALPGVFANQSATLSPQTIVIDPPQLILEEIYHLEKANGTFTPNSGVIVVSGQGAVSIVNTTIKETVQITNISTQPSPFEFKIVNELGKNTTIAFLDGTNGYLYNVTNSEDQITGKINNFTINLQNGAALLTEYPIFYTARFVFGNQVSPNSIPPPPGQNYSVDYVTNHTTELLNGGSGDEITQVWFNVTLIWRYDSSGNPEVINLWMNGTNEAPDLWGKGEWYQTHFSYGLLSYMWWGGFVSIYNQSLIKINVPPPAYGWDFGTYYSNESHQQPSPFGHYIFDNDTLNYYNINMSPTPWAAVWIAQM